MSCLKSRGHLLAKELTYRAVRGRGTPSETFNPMIHLRLVVTTLAAALIAGAASAQPAGGGIRQVCMADFQKACPDAKPGPGGGMRECATAHFAEFSQPCQSALQAMRARMQAARAARAQSAAPATNSP